MFKTIVVALIAITIASPAAAVSGAQFRQIPYAEGRGHLAGLIDGFLFTPVIDPADKLSRKMRANCMVDKKVGDDAIYAFVLAEIAADPKLLNQPVLQAVFDAMHHICD